MIGDVPAQFSDLDYSAERRWTWRDRFLEEMDAITPWTAQLEAIEKCNPKGKRGRPLIELKRMLWMYVEQHNASTC